MIACSHRLVPTWLRAASASTGVDTEVLWQWLHEMRALVACINGVRSCLIALLRAWISSWRLERTNTYPSRVRSFLQLLQRACFLPTPLIANAVSGLSS